MKRLLIFAVALMLVLCGCRQSSQPTQTTTAAATEETTVAPTTEPPRITVYPGAVEDYLGELGNGYDFSWEQVAPPEYVVIHFAARWWTTGKIRIKWNMCARPLSMRM